MRKIWISICIVSVLALAILVVVIQTKKEPGEIKIGAILPLTGDLGMYGTWAKQGIDLAIEEVNSVGGIDGSKIKIIYEDDQGDAKEAINAMQKLITIDRVPVIIGPLTSSSVLSVAPVAEKSKIVIISPTASSPEITKAGDYIFRNWPSDAFEGKIMAKFAFKKLNLRKVAVIYINNDYGVGAKNVFVKEFGDLGGTILIAESYEQGSTDFRTQLSKIKNELPDAIYAPGYSKELGLILRQAKEMRIQTQFLSGVDFEGPKTLEIAGEAAEGAIYATPGFNSESKEPVVQKFQKKFKAKYGKEAENFAAHSYDATKIIVQVIRNRGYSSSGIKRALYKIANYPGVTGITTFDEFGDVEKSYLIKTVKNGHFVVFE